MIKNISIYILSIIVVLILLLFFNNNKISTGNEFCDQLFLGKWKVTNIVPVETNIPSIYSGFDKYDNLRSQDLIDNIIGQEIFFARDYIENQGKIYELNEQYKTHKITILSEEMIIGSSSVKTLGITEEYFFMISFSINSIHLKEEGSRNFTSLNQLYLKDTNTIYASVDGFLIFELRRY